MRNLFSDLDGHEKETLFVIGNGFDLYHGLPMSYLHFFYWLKVRGEDGFIAALERLYPNKYGERKLLWYDFEKALGEFKVDDIFKQNFQGDSSNWYPQIDDVVTNQLFYHINRIKDYIKDWSRSVDIYKAKQLIPLSAESKYLTFNYTSTLEEIYKIPKSHICHIHGSNIDKEDIIVGHNTYIDTDKIESEEDDFWVGKAKVRIAECMCGIIKKCDVEIHQNKSDFFKSTKGINRIVVLGHSLSEIDKPYFGQLKLFANKDTHWHISKHLTTDH